MSHSTDPGHFFQTDASEATRARRAAKSGNKNGNPLKLQSKILSVVDAEPFHTSSIFVAESAGCVRLVNLKTRDLKAVYKGPTAPITSVAVGGHNGNTVFAGCWDKDVWSWNRESRVVGKKFKGHSDFVKTVTTARLAGRNILISGGADSKIIVWDADTAERIHTIRDKFDTMRALQYILIDPIESNDTAITLLSSSSDPHIRIWHIALENYNQILSSNFTSPLDSVSADEFSHSIKAHETSVYYMTFISQTEAEDSDLWTSSADGTAKCLSRSRNWEVDETLEHGDYVRCVAVSTDYIITAGRSEDVKVWDRNSGKLWHIFVGHFEEITGLLVTSDVSGEKVVSVSIDGTIRIWALDKKSLDSARREREDAEKGVAQEDEAIKPAKKNLMTAEEEAELAELMEDSD